MSCFVGSGNIVDTTFRVTQTHSLYDLSGHYFPGMRRRPIVCKELWIQVVTIIRRCLAARPCLLRCAPSPWWFVLLVLRSALVPTSSANVTLVALPRLILLPAESNGMECLGSGTWIAISSPPSGIFSAKIRCSARCITAASAMRCVFPVTRMLQRDQVGLRG